MENQIIDSFRNEHFSTNNLTGINKIVFDIEQNLKSYWIFQNVTVLKFYNEFAKKYNCSPTVKIYGLHGQDRFLDIRNIIANNNITIEDINSFVETIGLPQELDIEKMDSTVIDQINYTIEQFKDLTPTQKQGILSYLIHLNKRNFGTVDKIGIKECCKILKEFQSKANDQEIKIIAKFIDDFRTLDQYIQVIDDSIKSYLKLLYFELLEGKFDTRKFIYLKQYVSMINYLNELTDEPYEKQAQYILANINSHRLSNHFRLRNENIQWESIETYIKAIKSTNDGTLNKEYEVKKKFIEILNALK